MEQNRDIILRSGESNAAICSSRSFGPQICAKVLLMPMLIRVAVAFFLLGLATFCIFGFLATYEPPGFPAWRLIYGVAGLMALAGVWWVLTRRARAVPVAGSDGG